MMNHLIDCIKTLSEKYGEDRIIFVGLYGSQNYYLGDSKSDFDFKAIIAPTAKDVVMGKKLSTTIELEDGLCDVKYPAEMISCWKKQNVNFIELLFTDYKYINPDYHTIICELFERREEVVHYNEVAAINCIRGMQKEKFHALCKGYPSQIRDIETYGYSGKQLSHIIRLYDLLASYISGVSYKDALTISSDTLREEILNVKRYNVIYTPSAAEDKAKEIMAATDKLLESFTPHSAIQEIGDMMDDVAIKITMKAITDEALKHS